MAYRENASQDLLADALLMTSLPAGAEQTNMDGLPGSDRRRHTIRTLILMTRDAYLARHGLIALPDPSEEDERRRREFQEHGWVEHNPRPPREVA